MFLRKIIADSTSAAGRGALQAAREVGLATGGWPPENGAPGIPAASDRQMPGPVPTGRAAPTRLADERNVAAADGTLLLTRRPAAGNIDGIGRIARKYGRPCRRISLCGVSVQRAAGQVSRWLRETRLRVLHVAAAEDANDPLNGRLIHRILKIACLEALADRRAPGGSLGKAPPGAVPQSLEEAVRHLTTHLSLRDRNAISSMPEEELVTLNSTLGVFIHHHFRLRRGNRELMESCGRATPDPDPSAERAAGVIIERLWQNLRRTHRLRRV